MNDVEKDQLVDQGSNDILGGISDEKDQMIDSIKQCEPSQVNFGRNTNWKAIIPEPNSEDIKKLIEEVAKFTETIVIKKNLYKKYNEDLVLY